MPRPINSQGSQSTSAAKKTDGALSAICSQVVPGKNKVPNAHLTILSSAHLPGYVKFFPNNKLGKEPYSLFGGFVPTATERLDQLHGGDSLLSVRPCGLSPDLQG